MTHLSATLTQLRLSNPQKVTKTAIATVWKVQQDDGAPAALKIYHELDEKGEERGTEVLRAWKRGPAAKVIFQEQGIVLLEWLDGQSLGDLSRDGNDAAATKNLIDVARKCHGLAANPEGFEPLSDRFAPLFSLKITDDCPKDVRKAIAACCSLARELLDTSPLPTLLHGDLHHDNVLEGANGWTVIDAKGVSGDPAYEIANAFRNPIGNDAVMRDPKRIQSLAHDWAKVCDCSPKRVLGWAAAHSALSMAWGCDGKLGVFPDSDLPGFYLAQREIA